MRTRSHTWISVGIVVGESVDVETKPDPGIQVLGAMKTGFNFFDQVRIFAPGNLDRVFKTKALRKDRRTDRPPDGRTDGRTDGQTLL